MVINASSIAWAASPQVQELVDRIEKRQGSWIAFKAHMTLEAQQGQNPPAVCEGQLAYERLNEKMMLLCLGEKKDLLFAFKSEDSRFEFYQPATNRLYYGSIFDLEDHLSVESQIQPLDLYRAFKLNAVNPEKARIDSTQDKFVSLAVNGTFQRKSYFKRLLTVSPDGDVPLEHYFRPEGGMDVTIKRSGFLLHKKQGLSGRESYVFPNAVSVEEPGSEGFPTRQTTLTFSDFEFNPEIAFKDWELPIPENTQRIDVSEPFAALEKQVEGTSANAPQ